MFVTKKQRKEKKREEKRRKMQERCKKESKKKKEETERRKEERSEKWIFSLPSPYNKGYPWATACKDSIFLLFFANFCWFSLGFAWFCFLFLSASSSSLFLLVSTCFFLFSSCFFLFFLLFLLLLLLASPTTSSPSSATATSAVHHVAPRLLLLLFQHVFANQVDLSPPPEIFFLCAPPSAPLRDRCALIQRGGTSLLGKFCGQLPKTKKSKYGWLSLDFARSERSDTVVKNSEIYSKQSQKSQKMTKKRQNCKNGKKVTFCSLWGTVALVELKVGACALVQEGRGGGGGGGGGARAREEKKNLCPPLLLLPPPLFFLTSWPCLRIFSLL